MLPAFVKSPDQTFGERAHWTGIGAYFKRICPKRRKREVLRVQRVANANPALAKKFALSITGSAGGKADAEAIRPLRSRWRPLPWNHSSCEKLASGGDPPYISKEYRGSL